MTFQFDTPATPRGRVHTVQRVLRIMTILVAVFGLSFFAWRWMNPRQPKAAPAPETPAVAPRLTTDNETEYELDLRTFPLPARGDNTTVTPAPPAPPDNISTTAAIVGVEDVKDGALIERQPLYYLLREADEKYPADDLFMKRVPLTKLADLRARPQDFRGKPVAVRGRVVRVERSSLPENPSNVRAVLEGEMVVPGEGVCMFITSRVVALRAGMTVEFRGLFMKLMTYQAVDGHMELAPMVVASHPTGGGAAAAAPSTSTIPSGGGGWLIGILVVLFVIYIGLQFMLRRKGAGTNRAIEARRKARELLGRPAHDNEDLRPPTETPEDREP